MKLAIITGLEEERVAIEKSVGISRPINGFIFPASARKLKGHEILLIRCGPGKVNSSIATLDVIKNYSPNIIISCGLAGSLVSQLKPGSIIIASKVIQHDAIACSDKFTKRSLRVYKGLQWKKIGYLCCDKFFINLVKKTIKHSLGKGKVHEGILATGDQLILSKKYRKLVKEIYNAIAVDMESAAVAHVCNMFGIRFGAVRIISDTGNISINKKRAPSLILDKSNDVKKYSDLCAEILNKILIVMTGHFKRNEFFKKVK